jgi:hypothetical protein
MNRFSEKQRFDQYVDGRFDCMSDCKKNDFPPTLLLRYQNECFIMLLSSSFCVIVCVDHTFEI